MSVFPSTSQTCYQPRQTFQVRTRESLTTASNSINTTKYLLFPCQVTLAKKRSGIASWDFLTDAQAFSKEIFGKEYASSAEDREFESRARGVLIHCSAVVKSLMCVLT
jgi:hypothetical protein